MRRRSNQKNTTEELGMATVEREQHYLTVTETAAVLRQSRQTIRRKISLGEIPAVRLGEHGPLRVPVDAITEHLRPVRTAAA